MITATILLLECDAQEHDWTIVSLGFLGCSSLYRISIMGVLYHHYHLFSQNFTGRHDNRWHNASNNFWAPWMALVMMVIFLMPTVSKACSSPRCMDMISASVEVILVACIFGLCVNSSRI